MGHTAYGLRTSTVGADVNGTGPLLRTAGELMKPNVTTNTDRNTLKRRCWPCASTVIRTMSNPNCAQVDSRASCCRRAPSAYSRGRTTTIARVRPETTCKMRNLGAPFCHVCRRVIWNRIARRDPARQGQDGDQRDRPLPRDLDVLAVASDAGTMSDWWDQNSGWAGRFSSPRHRLARRARLAVTAIARYSGHIDVITVGTDNRVWSAWWDVSTGWSGWFAIGSLQCFPGSTVNVVARYSDHLDLFTTAADGRIMFTWWDARTGWATWFQVQGGVAAAGGAVTAIARYPFHLDLFAVGTDNRVWSAWWDDRSGWHGWFTVGNQPCRPDSTVNVVARYPDHLDLFTTASDGRIVFDLVGRPQRLGRLVPGFGRGGRSGVAGHCDSPLLQPPRPVRPRH